MDNFFLDAQMQNLSSLLRKTIGNTYIIAFGIIKEVPAEGVVTVEMSVAENTESVVITNCVLASFAGSSFAVNIKPNVNDKVLVFFPKNYSNDMFNTENNETIISETGSGYNLLSGIAVLMNQFQDSYKNFIDIADGKVTLKLAYANDKNLLEFSLAENGAVTVKNNNIQITTNADSAFTLTNGKATVTIDKDGNVNISADGKYTVSNKNTNLKAVIDGLAQELENLTTVGSCAKQATSPASKTSIGSWRTGKLDKLLQ